jgi:mRNA-degrading endonuclease toxin of MazEF toxin-antitoxin module
VVAVPFSRHTNKEGGPLIKINAHDIVMEDGSPSVDRVALNDQIRCLDKTRFRKKAGYISTRAIAGVLLGIDYLLGNTPAPTPRQNPTNPV